jgi:hypothetical protein
LILLLFPHGVVDLSPVNIDGLSCIEVTSILGDESPQDVALG